MEESTEIGIGPVLKTGHRDERCVGSSPISSASAEFWLMTEHYFSSI